MGNFEKLVVLTVLFLAVIILGVSLHQADEPELGGGPLGALEEPVASNDEAAPTGGNAALSSLTQPVAPKQERPVDGPADTTVKERPDFGAMGANEAAAKPQAAPAKAEPRGLLVTTLGLAEPLFGDDYMVYTWKSGDTLTALAERFYGDRNRRALIHTNNEGAQYRPGDQIMLPVRDMAAEAGQRAAFEPVPAHAKPVANQPAAEVLTYTVKDGDSLWGIAKDAYGKGTEWEQIYKANRDVMKNETDIKPGMVLRIP